MIFAGQTNAVSHKAVRQAYICGIIFELNTNGKRLRDRISGGTIFKKGKVWESFEPFKVSYAIEVLSYPLRG